jgi:hypothetical protein
MVRAGRDYREDCFGTPRRVFGQLGHADGDLCRPWGVCSDSKGNVLVANRTNHRIEVFTGDGTVRKRAALTRCQQMRNP